MGWAYNTSTLIPMKELGPEVGGGLIIHHGLIIRTLRYIHTRVYVCLLLLHPPGLSPCVSSLPGVLTVVRGGGHPTSLHVRPLIQGLQCQNHPVIRMTVLW